MAEYTLYTNPMSRGRIARWMCEEVAVPYDTVILDYRTTMKAPDYLAINPMGKVPAIRHGDVVVTEGAAICAYLADAFPDAGLAPDVRDPGRGAYYRWLFFAAGPIEAAVSDKSLGVSPEGDMQGSIGYGSLGRVTDTLEAFLKNHDHVLGDRFSAADVYVGSMVGWGMQFGALERRPAFVAYWDRLKDRPAAVRAREIDDALLPAKAEGSGAG